MRPRFVCGLALGGLAMWAAAATGAAAERSPEVTDAALSADGAVLAVAREDGTVVLRNLGEIGAKEKVLAAHQRGESCAALSPDGKLLATGGADCRVVLWDVEKGAEIRTVLKRAEENGISLRPEVLAFSPDGKRLAVGGNSKSESQQEKAIIQWQAVVIEVSTGRVVHRERGSEQWDKGTLTFSPDGKVLMFRAPRLEMGPPMRSVARVETMRLADGKVGEAKGIDADDYRCAAFSPDSKTLAVGTISGAIRQWEKDAEIGPLEGTKEAVMAVAFSRDGKRLVSADGGGQIRVFDSGTGKALRSMEDSPGILSLVPLPGGAVVAAVHADGTVSRWDFETGEKKEEARVPRVRLDLKEGTLKEALELLKKKLDLRYAVKDEVLTSARKVSLGGEHTLKEALDEVARQAGVSVSIGKDGVAAIARPVEDGAVGSLKPFAPSVMAKNEAVVSALESIGRVQGAEVKICVSRTREEFAGVFGGVDPKVDFSKEMVLAAFVVGEGDPLGRYYSFRFSEATEGVEEIAVVVKYRAPGDGSISSEDVKFPYAKATIRQNKKKAIFLLLPDKETLEIEEARKVFAGDLKAFGRGEKAEHAEGERLTRILLEGRKGQETFLEAFRSADRLEAVRLWDLAVGTYLGEKGWSGKALALMPGLRKGLESLLDHEKDELKRKMIQALVHPGVPLAARPKKVHNKGEALNCVKEFLKANGLSPDDFDFDVRPMRGAPDYWDIYPEWKEKGKDRKPLGDVVYYGVTPQGEVVPIREVEDRPVKD